MNRLQTFIFALVIAFGLGVLVTLECVEADAVARIRAARRMALDCPVADMLADPQPTSGGRT